MTRYLEVHGKYGDNVIYMTRFGSTRAIVPGPVTIHDAIPQARPEWATGGPCWETDAATVRRLGLEWRSWTLDRWRPASDMPDEWIGPFIAREPVRTVTLPPLPANLTPDEVFDAYRAAQEEGK